MWGWQGPGGKVVPESRLFWGLISVPREHVHHPQSPQQEVENSWGGGEEPRGFVESGSTQLPLPNSYLSGEGDGGEIE